MEVKNCRTVTISYIDDNVSKELLEKFQIKTKYETEPPRGDGIYSLSWKEKNLPFWVYGRNLILIDDSKLMLESVAYNTFSPIHSIMIDLKNEKYANLMEWYTELSFVNNRIELYNHIVKKKMLVINDWKDLHWMDL